MVHFDYLHKYLRSGKKKQVPSIIARLENTAGNCTLDQLRKNKNVYRYH